MRQSTVAWKWPRLYVESSEVRKTDNHPETRQSIYEFEVHKTTTFSKEPEPGIPMEVKISPQRDAFSSDYAFVMRHLHWAEGEQSFRFGDEEANRELMTIPECFLNSDDYQIVGEEDVDGVRCLHVASPNDDIWLAIDRGYLVHCRELRLPDTKELLVRSEILEYREIDTDLWLPQLSEVTHFDAGLITESVDNCVRRRERFRMREFGLGHVPVDYYQIEIPPGSYIVDLVRGRSFKPEPSLEKKSESDWELWRSPMVLGNLLALVLVTGWCVQRYAFGGRSRG